MGEDCGQPLLPAEKITNLENPGITSEPGAFEDKRFAPVASTEKTRQRLSYAANVTEVDVSLLRLAPTDKHWSMVFYRRGWYGDQYVK